MSLVARARRLAWVVTAVLLGAASPAGAGEAAPATRVVSMNPSLTATLVAIDAVGVLVGVDEYSARTEPAVRGLPTVGGLFNPGLEAVVALEPDLVAVVPSVQQRDFRGRLRELGIEVLELPNITLDELLESIELLGARVGHGAAADARVAAIRRTWAEVASRAAGRPRPSAVLVLQRDPLYVAGRGSFLDAMLRAAGVTNAAAKFPEPYPRVSVEWLVATAPEIIVDSADDPASALEHWSRWPSLPAVANGRVVEVQAGSVTLPGPHVDRSLRILASAIRAGVDDPGDAGDAGAESGTLDAP